MTEERTGYQDPYASEDIKRMREMYDHAIRRLVGWYLVTGDIQVHVKASRLLSLPPEFMHEVSRGIDDVDSERVLIAITFGDGDTYSARAVTDKGGKVFTGSLSKTDLIHILNEPEVMLID